MAADDGVESVIPLPMREGPGEGDRPMYTVAVQSEFIARHYMIGGDFGAENHPHSHRYRVEVRVSGDRLDRHGFVVDIDALSAGLETALAAVRESILNDLPEFAGLNPSIEHLARILYRKLSAKTAQARDVCVTVWESNAAWASYTESH
jgi:6-pyruvoyltetrahydropterin/6-carboxytetrahydropterin synthase